jgi:hypothetical protein
MSWARLVIEVAAVAVTAVAAIYIASEFWNRNRRKIHESLSSLGIAQNRVDAFYMIVDRGLNDARCTIRVLAKLKSGSEVEVSEENISSDELEKLCRDPQVRAKLLSSERVDVTQLVLRQ